MYKGANIQNRPEQKCLTQLLYIKNILKPNPVSNWTHHSTIEPSLQHLDKHRGAQVIFRQENLSCLTI